LLEYAKNYECELRILFNKISFDPYYKYALFLPWRNDFELPNSTYDYNSFVSINEGEIIGFIAYNINRIFDCAFKLQIINFQNNRSYIFGKDTMTCIKNIFEKYNFRKICFDIIIGNPLEKTYDKLIKKYGGRIVGIKEKEIKLIDGNYYDIKEYEILRENYKKYSNFA
jgi:hypothetical protein